MAWIYEQRKVWRGVALMVLVLAISGPWFFDRVSVPGQFPCSPPNIRLNDEFCGLPMSGAWAFFWLGGGLIVETARLFTGTSGIAHWDRALLSGLIMVLLALPFFSTLLALRGGERRHGLQVATWGGAAVGCVIFGAHAPTATPWPLWGVWLFAGLAVVALSFETVAMVSARRTATFEAAIDGEQNGRP